jgi:hypothetical protein
MSPNKPLPPAGGRVPPSEPHRRRSTSEELFGRAPFSAGPDLRYYGTGVAGYTSGPGFTGGYYGFGDEPAPIPTELEREYLQYVYGAQWESEPQRPAQAYRGEPPKRYPPGPKGYQRSDQRIREDLCDRLMRARHIDSSEVTVEVTNGKVVLEGTVPERRMKHAIEDMAATCLGVQDIDNRVRVVAPETTG